MFQSPESGCCPLGPALLWGKGWAPGWCLRCSLPAQLGLVVQGLGTPVSADTLGWDSQV